MNLLFEPSSLVPYEAIDSNVHTDVARMEELGLVERTDVGDVLVPYESIEILVPLARAVA